MTAKDFFRKEVERINKNIERFKDKQHPTRMQDMERKRKWYLSAIRALEFYEKNHGSMLAAARKDFDNE